MDTYKTNARMVGILFLAAIAAGVLAIPLLQSIQEAPDDLAEVSENESQVLLGALFMLIMAVACASIVIPMYPVLKKHNEPLALSSVGFRLIESVTYLVFALIMLSIVKLSQEFVEAGAPDTSYYQTLATLLLAASDWIFLIGSGLFFPLAAQMYCYIFYQSKLVPRWLSGWGFIAATLMMINAMLVILDIYTVSSIIFTLLNVPLALNEITLAIWLIVKGFDPSAL
ncbi:MAG: DUF4386 domain-containing protein [Candidatus Thorarchaeota archaeon]